MEMQWDGRLGPKSQHTTGTPSTSETISAADRSQSPSEKQHVWKPESHSSQGALLPSAVHC